ncbi:MAG: hypothetical protein DMD28_05870 [Gemmatimonadetes bacterium]|nr:MAG: hypothetical protein DMD28_05870 [Gemmatimonadota bacterium]
MTPHAPRIALAVVLLLCACKPPGEGVIALEGGTLIDGSGTAPAADALVLVEQGHIRAVTHMSEADVPRGAQVVNVAGKTIIPGLIDAHAHVERWAAGRYIAWGVTTVRDMHSRADSGFALRNDLNLAAILGPRMFTAGPLIDGAPPTYKDATGVAVGAEARKAVDQRAVAGADYIAIYTRITPALLRPLMDEAGTLRLAVAAHLGKIDALAAARAGVASIEHMSGVVEAASPNPASYYRAHDRFLAGWTMEETGWGRLDSGAIARTARALARSRVAIVPTLVQHEMLSRLNDPTLLTRPTMADVPRWAASVRDVAGLLKRSGWRPADFAAFRRGRARQDQFVREFKRAGGLIAAGSDAASPLLVPGAALHDELELLVSAGLTPLEAIGAATRQAAQLLRADSLGLLAPGKVADLVVLNGNPATDIAATRDIAWVMTRGRIVYPDSVRRGWPK